MPSPYSKDLRLKAVHRYINNEKNTTLEIVAKSFDISPTTLQRWVKRYKDEGHADARSGYQKGQSHVIEDLDEFAKLVEKEDFASLNSIVEKLGKGSKSSISRALKKISFVKKRK